MNHNSDLHNGSPNFQKWLHLVLMGTVSLGCSFVYDIPQALQVQFQNTPLNLDYFKFDMLYSVYSIPNIILPLLGGCFTKIVGVRLALIIFAYLVLQGQMIFGFGVYWGDYTCMIIGRVIYAVGAENLYLAQLTMAVQSSSSKELTFVIGWNNSISYLANVINGLTTPLIFQKSQKLWAPSVFGVILCLVSLFCALGVSCMKRTKESPLPMYEPTSPMKSFCSEVVKYLKEVPALFWALTLYYIFTFPDFKAFTDNMNDQVHKRFGFNYIKAAQLGLLYYMQLIIVSPLLGILIDKYGKRWYWLVTSAILAVASHLLFSLLKTQADEGYIVVLPLILLGTAHAIFETTSWSCICIAAGEDKVEMGFGIAASGMNAMTVLVLIILGKVSDYSKKIEFGYFYSEIFLEIIAIGSILVLLTVMRFDFVAGKTLFDNRSRKEEKITEISPSFAGTEDDDEKRCLVSPN